MQQQDLYHNPKNRYYFFVLRKLLYHNHNFEFEKINGEYALDVLYQSVPAEFLQTEIDTCWVNDIKVYETAVKELNMDWVVVERFKSAETAKMAHFAWVQKIKDDGVRFFKSAQDGCIYGVVKED